MSPNAFIGQAVPPTDDQLTAELGAARALWDELLAALDLPVREWNSYSLKAGWSLKLRFGKRTIVYISPCGEPYESPSFSDPGPWQPHPPPSFPSPY